MPSSSAANIQILPIVAAAVVSRPQTAEAPMTEGRLKTRKGYEGNVHLKLFVPTPKR